jgi:2-polyprenyl-6-methoxyphenol hydroxylase-like FAD-dependent oxidoreductase
MKVLIIGGGIGGLATALSLHAAGIECAVFEQSRGIRELGVGINLLPHAVKELAGLDLLDALDRVAIRTHELIYANRFGQAVWREPRGLDAGYDYPQFSIHRGKLQGVLYAAARARIGEHAIHLDHQLRDIGQDEHGVTATFVRRTGSGDEATARGDVLIAADGIHSTVRRAFYWDEGSPAWNGLTMWRGAVECAPFLTGRSMLIAGGMKTKLVLYPISNQTTTPGTNLLNWVVCAKVSDEAELPSRRDDWNRRGSLDELLPHVAHVSRISVVDLMKVVRATHEIYEYPMCDRDPLPRWSFGRVTLLGDAAHLMYPVGSNGASQAILDARALARHLSSAASVPARLAAYDAERRPQTAAIVLTNRRGGPERVIDVVETRAPDGFSDVDAVASYAEREAIVRGYASLAGYAPDQVNTA